MGHHQLWAIIYPIDVVKSRMQTDGFGGDAQKYRSTLDCVRKVWRAEGVKGFTRGLGPTLLRQVSDSSLTSRKRDSLKPDIYDHPRSPFSNGATFVFFELASRALR